ncbi:MAG: ComEA family DNA-binding protein [Micrococcaceae bacterium]
MDFDFDRAFDQAHHAIQARWKVYLAATFSLLLVAIVAFFALSHFSPSKKTLVSKATASPSAFQSHKIAVHITGAINKPGVYSLAHGTIGMQLVEQAGGFTPQADQHATNLARKLEDGQQLHIPHHGEQNTDTAAGESISEQGNKTANKKININKASAAELESLPKIGPAMAQKIIAHREEHQFQSLSDLDAVEGIGPKMLESLKDLVTF